MSIQYRIENTPYKKFVRESGSKYDPIFEQLKPGQRAIVPIADLEKISQALRKFVQRKGLQVAGSVKIEKQPVDENGKRLEGEGALYLLQNKPAATNAHETTPTPVEKPRTVIASRSPWPTATPKAKPAATKKKA